MNLWDLFITVAPNEPLDICPESRMSITVCSGVLCQPLDRQLNDSSSTLRNRLITLLEQGNCAGLCSSVTCCSCMSAKKFSSRDATRAGLRSATQSYWWHRIYP